MRIFYVAVDTPIPGTHGGSVHAWELCQALARRGHEVHLVAPGSPQAGDTGRSAQVTRHLVPRPPRFLEWSAVRRVRRLAQEVAPDVVVERFYTFGGAAIWAAHSLGLPAVLEVNSPARRVAGSWRDRLDGATLVRPIDRWRRRLLAWTDGIYTTSAHLVPPELASRVTVVTNGVDVARFQPGEPRRPSAPLRCVYASSFRVWHGAEDLVKAVAVCVARGVALHVTCLGRGPLWESARRDARQAGLDEVMTFPGEVPAADVPRYLADADVGLAPFTPSAFTPLRLGWFWSPIKLFEYLAAGLAVVTIDIPELRALLPAPVGRFYPAGQPDALADELERLASPETAFEPIRETARSLAETRYTWGHQAARVEQLLERVVDAARAG